jgi:hypothetical protein
MACAKNEMVQHSDYGSIAGRLKFASRKKMESGKKVGWRETLYNCKVTISRELSTGRLSRAINVHEF